MMRALALLLLIIPAAAQAAPQTYYFDLTGEQFVDALYHPEPWEHYHYYNRDRAYSYMDGAKDATVGSAWCPPRPRKTHELAYDAADYIKTLPVERRKANAAPLLLEFLAKQYPCKGSRQ
jgi:hypothetical protein